jgi:tetratricopeptide (TPR) repeat protein
MYHSALAGLLQKAGRLEDAKPELEAAIDCKPSEAVQAQLLARLEQVNLELGAQLAKARRYRVGAAVAADAARRSPQSAAVLQMLGFFQTKLQLNLEAVKSYERALKIDPDSRDASLGLGIAQSAAGMLTEAVQTLEAGTRRYPKDALHFQALGGVLTKLSDAGSGDLAKAKRLFESALAIDPTLAESHYQLGNFALQEGDLDGASTHLLEAERSASNESRIHFALARLYRRKGQSADAEREVAEFQKAKAAEQPDRVSALGASAK